MSPPSRLLTPLDTLWPSSTRWVGGRGEPSSSSCLMFAVVLRSQVDVEEVERGFVVVVVDIHPKSPESPESVLLSSCWSWCCGESTADDSVTVAVAVAAASL